MLILSRERGQRVIITVPPSVKPTRIVVEASDVGQSKVRLGFASPRDVAINRGEVQAEIDGGSWAAEMEAAKARAKEYERYKREGRERRVGG